MPSILPLEARSVWCQARISSDQAVMVSTMMLLCLSSRDLGEVLLVAFGEVVVLGQFAGLVEVAEPSEGLRGRLGGRRRGRGRGVPVGPASRL